MAIHHHQSAVFKTAGDPDAAVLVELRTDRLR
jgi:hypothetical protein